MAGIKGGYWRSWSPADFPSQLFTHTFYAFIDIDQRSFQLSLTPSDEEKMNNFTAALRSMRPRPKAFLSIGGANETSTRTFSEMAKRPTTRSNFIDSTIRVARKHGFDGIDLDWEFPETTQDMSNLSMLLNEWYIAVERDSRSRGATRLLLSAAVFFAPEFEFFGQRRTYPIAAIRDCLDFVSPMCYDYRGSWDTSATGAHALLYDNNDRNINTSYGISSWISRGVPPNKIVMGLPLYGKTWKLANPNSNGIRAPAIGVGPGENGIMPYREIVEFNKSRGAVEKFDEETVSMYSYAGRDWIGYDGPQSIATKVEFAKDKGLAGYFFWALGFDKDWQLSRTGLGSLGEYSYGAFKSRIKILLSTLVAIAIRLYTEYFVLYNFGGKTRFYKYCMCQEI